jgi:hypothetical protein
METIQDRHRFETSGSGGSRREAEKINRSALFRDALREHLKRLRTEALEEREKKSCEAHPDTEEDWDVWEREAAWPKE